MKMSGWGGDEMGKVGSGEIIILFSSQVVAWVGRLFQHETDLVQFLIKNTVGA
jgi:hypothetical protein